MGRHAISVMAVLAIAAAAPSAWALDLGEKAPELDVTGWAQGEAVKLSDGVGKSVFVVEFCETFQPDCADLFAAATKLQTKYKGKGLEVLAVTTDPAEDVKKFLADHPTNLRIALDGDHNTIATFAGEKPRIPFAVVVDKSGAVAYAGGPGRSLERRVDDVVSGKFDLTKALEVRRLEGELTAAIKAEENDKTDPLCDQILALDPANTDAFDRRCRAFGEKTDLDGYRKFVKACADRAKDDLAGLSWIAWKLIDDGRWTWRDPDLALASAKRAVDLSKSGDADVLDTYAHVLAAIGLVDQAVEQEKKAVALDAKDEDYKKRLAFYESCLAVRQKAGPPGKK